MAKFSGNNKQLARLMAAGARAKSVAKSVKGSGAVERAATIGTTVMGGAAGGLVNGLMGSKKLLGLKPSTITGAATSAVSLFLKGSTGDRLAELGAGQLALSAGQATEKAVKKSKVGDFLDTLSDVDRAALDERKNSFQNLTPDEQSYIQNMRAQGGKAPALRRLAARTRMAGEIEGQPEQVAAEPEQVAAEQVAAEGGDTASGTALTAAELEAYAKGTVPATR